MATRAADLEVSPMEAEQTTGEPDLDAIEHAEDDVGDDLPCLIFTACHPVLSSEALVEDEVDDPEHRRSSSAPPPARADPRGP